MARLLGLCGVPLRPHLSDEVGWVALPPEVQYSVSPFTSNVNIVLKMSEQKISKYGIRFFRGRNGIFSGNESNYQS